jgi:hypothetical protein
VECALLKAGAEMLRTHSLEEWSIETLCREVGAFYSRFEGKEAYFNVLIELAARDGGRALTQIPSTAKLRDTGLARLCLALVRGLIGWMRDHKCVLRTALQQVDRGGRAHGGRSSGWRAALRCAVGSRTGAPV